MSVVELRRASRLWDGEAGLHPIDLTVEAGELVVVRGRSGSGKSTLLALVGGLCTPGTGEVVVLGSAPRLDTSWTQIAIVPQVLALLTELTIRENVAECAAGVDPTTIDELLRQLDVLDLADRTIGEVSMGQQQRAAVARAMIAAPRLLLADEPTSFQDGTHTQTVVDALREAAKQGAAVLVATHDEPVSAAADRIVDLTAAG
jgi:putative ABC transport system ATP-binding protein